MLTITEMPNLATFEARVGTRRTARGGTEAPRSTTTLTARAWTRARPVPTLSTLEALAIATAPSASSAAAEGRARGSRHPRQLVRPLKEAALLSLAVHARPELAPLVRALLLHPALHGRLRTVALPLA